MKRFLTICILSALIVSLLSGCGAQDSEEPETVTASPETTAAPTATVTPETAVTAATEPPVPPQDVVDEPAMDDSQSYVDIYEPILNSYYDTLSQPLDAEALFNSELCFLCLYCYEGEALMNVGYKYCDLDGDGGMELLIGAISEDEYLKNVLLDLYCIEDGQVKLVLQSQERQRYFLDTEGHVLTDWSNSASDSGLTLLEYSAGALTEIGPADSPEYMDLGLEALKTFIQ